MANPPSASRNTDKDQADSIMARGAATQQEALDRIAEKANEVQRGVRGAAATAAANGKRA